MTGDDISRRCLHIHEWPEIDQELWHQVTAQGSVLDGNLNRSSLWCAPSRNKRARMKSPATIADWSFARLDELNNGWLKDTQNALAYRNTLMVAVLVHCPIRLRNLVMIRIGKHLNKVDDRYKLDFEPSEVKTDRYLTHFLPTELTSYVDAWLGAWRPVLLNDPAVDALWIGIRGKPMRNRGVYGCVVATTEAAFGISINPHLFRDIAASWVVDMTPENVGIASSLLGHINPATTENHYIQANQAVAGARYRSSIDALHSQFKNEYGNPFQERRSS